MAKDARHVGPIGTGNVAKLVRNLLNGAETLVIHEALRLADANGIPYVQALELLAATQGPSLLSRWQRTFDPSGADPTPRGGGNIMNKDVPMAAELARLSDLDLPIMEQLGAAALRLSGGTGR
jgi:3-hydroxyisobutyrate dehydrogenase-like beta-hydroxyacid dehydrogenase